MNVYDNLSSIQTYFYDVLKEIAYKNGLKEMELIILGYFSVNEIHNTATDFIKSQNSTKSHVSSSIKSLCNKGYLTQYYSKENKKTIHLSVTEAGKDICFKIQSRFEDYMLQVLKNFDESELILIQSFIERLGKNSREGLESRKKH